MRYECGGILPKNPPSLLASPPRPRRSMAEATGTTPADLLAEINEHLANLPRRRHYLPHLGQRGAAEQDEVGDEFFVQEKRRGRINLLVHGVGARVRHRLGGHEAPADRTGLGQVTSRLGALKMQSLKRASSVDTLASSSDSLARTDTMASTSRVDSNLSRTYTSDSSLKNNKGSFLHSVQLARRLAGKSKELRRVLRRRHGASGPEEGILLKALMDIGLLDQESDETVVEVLYEHQRGRSLCRTLAVQSLY